jgi:predicted DNA-binding protein
MASITFKLPETLKEKLEQAAIEDGRTISEFIRHHFNKKLAPQPPTKPTRRTAAKTR